MLHYFSLIRSLDGFSINSCLQFIATELYLLKDTWFNIRPLLYWTNWSHFSFMSILQIRGMHTKVWCQLLSKENHWAFILSRWMSASWISAMMQAFAKWHNRRVSKALAVTLSSVWSKIYLNIWIIMVKIADANWEFYQDCHFSWPIT